MCSACAREANRVREPLSGCYCHLVTLFEWVEQKDLGAFPTITTVLAGSSGSAGSPVRLPLNPSQYMPAVNGSYCLGIVSASDSGGTIMGDVLMQGFTSIFDRQNSRVGFAPLSC